MTDVLPAQSARISPDRFRQAFRRHPAGVVVVTVDAGRGPVGFTATSLSSLSLDPPLVSFGIAVTSSCWPHVRDAGTAVINLLGAEQEALARRFATSGINRFAEPTCWHRLAGGEPALDGTAGLLTIRIERLVAAGDHRLVLARVEEAWLPDGHRPLVHHDGRYHSI
ncbi:flavin reductase family protein [Kitasatospora sp. GAS204B]|uniref:flavin reductase family protein n=1 Tax=unclassified Kitasatospora TaxID=2633591 RepID=UPI0024760429|nr:flavin reductase family protein [Kitasatospora sp. GAS204B]MDH6122351.1 flavin reductase (DIM6/NTAB) family NADH-FMN oxidoreductase RutF [Kitasatospora sp. GAS204B]